MSAAAHAVAGAREPIPEGLTVDRTPDGAVYSWSVLPNHPGLIALFVLLAVPLVLLGPLLLIATVLDRFGLFQSVVDGAAGEEFKVLVLCLLSIMTGPFFATILLGSCRLTVSEEGVRYEVFLLGRRSRRQSRWVRASELRSFRIKDPVKGGIQVHTEYGKPFYLKLPVGAGGFSIPELLRLKQQWLRDLGREETAQT